MLRARTTSKPMEVCPFDLVLHESLLEAFGKNSQLGQGGFSRCGCPGFTATSYFDFASSSPQPAFHAETDWSSIVWTVTSSP
jgi:hypothetical protein